MLRRYSLQFESLDNRTVLASDAAMIFSDVNTSDTSTDYQVAPTTDSQSTDEVMASLAGDPLVKDFVNDWGKATGNDDLLYDLGLDVLNDRLRMSDLDRLSGFEPPPGDDIDALLQALSDYVDWRLQPVPK